MSVAPCADDLTGVRWRRGCHVATSDPIAEIIGDYRAFAAMQRDRLSARGIDISPYALSHIAVRVADWDLYVHQRTLLERHARANRESVWNGRPISLIVLAEPLYVLFEDFTHVKFYRRSFFDVVEDEEGRFEGFSHVDDWVPQRLVTATGPNPLPR